MSDINTYTVSKMIGIKESMIYFLIRFCPSFPKPLRKGRYFIYNLDLIQQWSDTHNAKNELRYAYQRKNKEYAQSKYNYDHPESTVIIDKNLMLQIKKFIRCDYTRWRKFENRDLFADYLISEKLQKQLNFTRRIGL